MADPLSKACVPLSGNRHYYDSDYMVHRRAEFMVTLRMYSNRTLAARCVNSQGKMDSREADGVTNLFVSGAEYDNIFGAWDFHRIAGMSSEVDVPLMGCRGYDSWPHDMNYTTFVGGVSDGTMGAAAMNLSSGTLHVQNAWFFFDHGYVHLGASLRCATGSAVATTLAHRRLDLAEEVHVEGGTAALPLGEQNYTVEQAPSWVWMGAAGQRGQGYRPLYESAVRGGLTGRVSRNPRVLRLRTGNETGNWSRVGTSHGLDTLSTFQLSFELGTCAEASSGFGYAVQASASLAEMKGEVQWVVVANTAVVQAVREGDHTIQAIFWSAGELSISNASANIQTLRNSAPALVLVKVQAGSLIVSASEPSGEVGALRVEVRGDGTFTGSNCTTAASGGTVFELTLPGKGDWQGKTMSVSCHLEGL